MKIAINGYGHVGRGVEAAVRSFPDLELCGIFTRRPRAVEAQTDVPVWDAGDAETVAERAAGLDVVVMCGGSADDLPRDSPRFARLCSIVDSFDRHESLDAHLSALDAASREGGHVAITGAGWDPGLMSLARLYFAAVLPQGQTLTQWGPGISRGHTEFLRGLPGVERAVQFTIPLDADAVLAEVPDGHLVAQALHRRECYIVASGDANRAALERAIRAHEYFRGYETVVNFVTEEEFGRIVGDGDDSGDRRAPSDGHDHTDRCSTDGRGHADRGSPSDRRAPADRHGGLVERVGVSGGVDRLTLRLELHSNALFTGSVLCAAARAAGRMSRAGNVGAYTLAGVAPGLLAGGEAFF